MYGVKFISQFDRLDNDYPEYELRILQKEYSGGIIRLTGGAIVTSHKYDEDNPKATIKGSSLSVTLVNEGNFPLTSLYSVDDDEYKLILIWKTTFGAEITMFEGFLVQDDCSEPLVDFNHEITLSANDNLGLLKDVSFDKAPASYSLIFTSTESYSITQSGADTILLVDIPFGDTLIIGDKISIDGGPSYVIANLYKGGTVWNVYLAENIASVSPTTGSLGVYRNVLLDQKITLLTVIKVCLSATNLELFTKVFCNINETTQDPNTCFLEQTLIDPQTFLQTNATYDDCYTVLEKVLGRFGFTLLQVKGSWNIVRLGELRYYNYSIPGFIYDSNFNYLNRIELNEGTTSFAGWPKFLIGLNEVTKAETGLTSRITRPDQFVKETFNYKQPEQLLRNFDLQQLGSLVRTYVDGSNTVNEYNVPWWYNAVPPGSSSPTVQADYFIRVVTDNLGNEIDRYLVVKDNNITSYPIEVNEGDSFKYTFSFRTADSQPGNLNINFEVKLINGTLTRFAREPGDTFIEPGWGSGPGWTVNIPSGDNTDVWHTVEISSQPIPFSGLLYCHLMIADQSGTDNGTYYRDIRFEYTTLINQSTKIIGQTHESQQLINAKNNESGEIFIDNSPRNSIAGTLFLPELDGLLQKRCELWKRATFTEEKKLGEITTEEILFLRRVPRTLLEGTFYGLRSFAGDHLNILNVITYTYFLERNFIFGRLEIDYKNNRCSGTLYEFYKDSELDSDLTYFYEFNFLYANK